MDDRMSGYSSFRFDDDSQTTYKHILHILQLAMNLQSICSSEKQHSFSLLSFTFTNPSLPCPLGVILQDIILNKQ